LPDIHVCGPPVLVEAVTDVATAGGIPQGRVFRELFLPTGPGHTVLYSQIQNMVA
jgi:ferredoxin-NADP reductase